jgi:purine-binding chemotaxis protein CheW
MDSSKQYNKSSYLSYKLNNEYFAIDVNSVLEIMELPQLTIVPNTSEHIKGVLNFRGEIVPVINMHKRFNLNSDDNNNGMVIIINFEINDSQMHLGLMVDEVSSVIEFKMKDIRNIPDMGINYNSSFVSGMVERDEKFMMILNIDNVFNLEELAECEVV